MENLKLNHAKGEINLLTKQLNQWKKDYGELLLANGDIQQQLSVLTHEREDLQSRLATANDMSVVLKEESEAKIRGFENQIQLLKKQNGQLNEEIEGLQATKVKYEEELGVLKKKITIMEEEKDEIRMKEREENSRVSIEKDNLERKLSTVLDVAADKFRGFEKRLAKLEQDVANLSSNSFPLGSHVVDTLQAVQEQESFGPEAKSNGLVGAQPEHEVTPIEEKTASSMSSPKGVTVTCVKDQSWSFVPETRPARPVGTEEKLASSMPCHHNVSSAFPVVLSSSDDDDDDNYLPLSKGLKRKLLSSEVSLKTEDGGGSFSKCRLKEQKDSIPEALNSSQKTLTALRQCDQKFRKWDYDL